MGMTDSMQPDPGIEDTASKNPIRSLEAANNIVQEMESHLDMICHELRNPMSSIMQSAEYVRDSLIVFKETGKMDLDGLIDTCQTILLCVSHQKRILDNTLTVSKEIKAKHLEEQTIKKRRKNHHAYLTLKAEPIHPVSLIYDCVKMLRADYKGGQDTLPPASIKFTIDESYHLHSVNWVEADESKLAQMVVNLLGNAIKFTKECAKREIEVRLGASKTLPVKNGEVIFLARNEIEASLTDSDSDEGQISASSEGIDASALLDDSISRRSARIFNIRKMVKEANLEFMNLFTPSEGFATEKETSQSDAPSKDDDASSIYTDAAETSPVIAYKSFDPKPMHYPKLSVESVDESHVAPSSLGRFNLRKSVGHDGSYYRSPLLPKDNPDLMSESDDAKSFILPEGFLKPDFQEDDIDFESEDLYLLVSVRDTGIGINPEKIKLLFKQFSQVSGVEAKYGGSGLGLYISREIARMHGGDLGVWSKYGSGSNFAFYIKVKTCQRPEYKAGGYAQGFRGTTAPSMASGVHVPSRAQSFSHIPSNMFDREAPAQGISFLFVEDNVLTRDVLEKRLKQLGCHIQVAGDGKQAIEFLLASKAGKGARMDAPEIDVVLMDSQLPGMNGADCAKAIRALEKAGKLTRYTAIIGTPGNINDDGIKCMRAAGMDDVICKPFEAAELIRRAFLLLKRRSISNWTGMNNDDSSDANSIESSPHPASSMSDFPASERNSVDLS